MDWRQHIERVPGVMRGKPVFRGTRITVEFILERLAQGARAEDLVRSHQSLTVEHVSAALAHALLFGSWPTINQFREPDRF